MRRKGHKHDYSGLVIEKFFDLYYLYKCCRICGRFGKRIKRIQDSELDSYKDIEIVDFVERIKGVSQ